MFRYESSTKSKTIETIMGILFGFMNGILMLSVVLSMLFYSISLKDQVIQKLNDSKVFNYIYIVKTRLVDYGK